MSKNIKIKPRAGYVLVKQDDEKANVSEHGIVTPDAVEQEQKAFGTVVAIGKGVEDIKIKDRVVYGVYAGDTIQIKEKGKEVEYIILKDEFILAFLEE